MATNSIPCALIGEGNLLLKCINILLENGFILKLVFTNTSYVSQLCEEKRILCQNINASLEDAFRDNAVDYLFSINNPRVLKKNELNLPRILSINYHDSPLPAYAGINATSWAILQGERKHGISWHVIEAGIDTGDILESQEVTIENNESAFSLNMKCQEAAFNAFCRLIDGIKHGTLMRKQQNQDGRSYFGLYALPPNLGVLNFHNDADEIYNLSRALEFGINHDNAFGSPKILAATGEFFLVTNVDRTANFVNESATPSQIVDIVGDTLVVATRTTPLLVSLATLDGVQIPQSRHKEIGFYTGSQVSSVSIDHDQLTSIRKMEGFWRRKLSSYEPTIFYRQRINVVTNITDFVTDIHIRPVTIPLPYINWIPTHMNTELFLQACFVAFMARVSCLPTVAIGLLADKSGLDASVESMFSDITPGLFNVAFDENITDVISKCLEDLTKYTNAKTFLKDVFYRYPELRGQKRTPHHNLVIGTKSETTFTQNVVKHILHDCTLLLLFYPDTREMRLLYNERPAQDFTHVVDVLRHFPTFLSSMNMKINPILKDIVMLSKDELDYLFPCVEVGKVKTKESLPTLIQKQCQLSPNSIALKSMQHAFTYEGMQREIAYLSAKISRHLLKRDKGKPVVGLYFPNSIQYVLSLLATIESNAAFLPLPLDYPPDRLAFSMCDAKVCQILTTRFETPNFPMRMKSVKVCFQHKVAGVDVYLVEFTFDKEVNKLIPTNGICECMQNNVKKRGPNDEHENLDSQVCINKSEEEEDFCYVMYTSGSTGRPKGVKVKESSVINLARAQIKEWDLGPDDNSAQFASIGFDASVSEIFTAFLSGGTLSVLSPDERLGKEFINAMKALKVTIITLAPSALNIYRPQDLPSLKKLVSAGEACTLSTAVRWTNNTSIRFFNAYGPTEGTVCSTCYEFIPGTRYEDVNRELPIGRAIDGVCVYLLDDFMKPVPPGIVGEIYIGGKGLAHGYIGKAKHFNDQRFVPNPIDPHMSLYKSGDHAFMAPDGTITYAGRLDDQVKIRGQRVDLSEIENVLIQHPKIEMAVVVVHKCSSSSDPKIACFVAPTFVYTLELREYLSKALPKYMIPNFIRKFELSEFPLTPNGKVDRKLLEVDESVHDQEHSTGRSHLNDIQLFLARRWCEVLKLDVSFVNGLHPQSSFSELGGNSLQLILLLRTFENTLGLSLSFTDVGTADTIEEFVEVIERKKDVLHKSKHVFSGKQELRDLIVRDSTLDVTISSKTKRRKLMQFKRFSIVGKKCSLKNPRNILISGVTGFLGAFLLAELLEQTSAHICCMVRESTESRGLGRIIKNMRIYNLWKSEYTSRITIVLSDLSQERMGVTEEIYNALCNVIDVVFMNAAMMNFNMAYQDHRIINVEGTKKFIKFAMTGVQKYIFLTSSLSVFLFPKSQVGTSPSLRTCYESECFDDPMLIEGGYGQSKWACERLVLQALEHLPGGAIFRPARISGRSTDGVGPQNDLFGCTMLGMKRLGCYPNLKFPFDLTPVDYVAKAMVEISLRMCNESGGHHEKMYHLFNKDTIPFNKLFEDMNLRPLLLDKWREELKHAPDANKELIPLTPFFFSAFWDKASQWPVFDTSNTDALTSDKTKALLHPSEELLKLYKAYFGV